MKWLNRLSGRFLSDAGMSACLVVASLFGTGLVLKESITYQAYLLAGNSAFNQSNFGDAEVYYSKVFFQDTSAAELDYNIANTYYQQGRYKEAITAYNRAIAHDSNEEINAAARANLGNAYFMAGDTIKSLEVLQTALLLDRNNTKVRQNYLFVLDKVKASENDDEEDPKNIQQEKGSDKFESKSRPESNEKGKPTNEQPDQEYGVSEQEMNNLFNMINQSEKSAQKRLNKTKQKHKPLPTDGYAY